MLCNSQEWHPSPLVSLKVLNSCGHTPSVPDPSVTLGPWLTQVLTYPVSTTWNNSESASKYFATHKNGMPPSPLKVLISFVSARDVGSLVGAGTHLPCGYMEQLRVCLKVLCNSQEWHPSPLVSLKILISCGHTPSVPDPRVTLGPWLAQVHTYPVIGYMEQLVRLSTSTLWLQVQLTTTSRFILCLHGAEECGASFQAVKFSLLHNMNYTLSPQYLIVL